MIEGGEVEDRQLLEHRTTIGLDDAFRSCQPVKRIIRILAPMGTGSYVGSHDFDSDEGQQDSGPSGFCGISQRLEASQGFALVLKTRDKL